MITSLRLIDFKNFADATLRMGPFTVIVGANASGKSNLRDAFRILHGIGRGYNLADIVGGKYGAGGHVEWNQIRGAFGEIIRFERPAFGLHVAMRASAGSTFPPGATIDAHYSIKVGGDETFKNTSVVCRRADADTAVVRPVASLSNADELRQSQGLGRLHASGWMEDAIFFTEGTENEEPRWT